MERFVCVHGHFYQPPRENPWLEAVQVEDSAYPYHDWNERITAECYAPNASARILDDAGLIARIVNNYAAISFDFGPTLLAWLERSAPDVYARVIEADRLGGERFSGHGGAMAQAYNHMILPLANARDRHTQVAWGVYDFVHRFGRAPEGMWLPEAAVDMASLDALAQAGIRFTVLSPYQLARVRPVGASAWTEVGPDGADPSQPYRVALPSGRQIAVFLYDGPLSQAIAFGGLLHDGAHLAERLVAGVRAAAAGPRLASVATDGETYGHHHRHGEMALAFALERIEAAGLARVTTYAEHLARLGAPALEAQIRPDSSWSCAHGVERWRADCGCSTGAQPTWTQGWRRALREALDDLRDRVGPRFEAQAGALLADPWRARDAYIEVVLDRSPETVDRFLAAQARTALDPDARVRALKLLELQRHAMLMYTSCGWFFDDIAGLEAVQVLRYAGRVVHLARDLFGVDLEGALLERLAQARGNRPEAPDGRQVYLSSVRPAMVSLTEVGAHVALTELFVDERPGGADGRRVYCYEVTRREPVLERAGGMRLSAGALTVRSAVTLEAADLFYGVAHLGDHNVVGGVRPLAPGETWQALVEGLAEPFRRAHLAELVRAMDRVFGARTYTLADLFRDEQRQVIGRVVAAAEEEAAAAYGQIYEHHAALMRYLAQADAALPAGFAPAAAFVLGQRLRQALGTRPLDLDGILALWAEARSWGVRVDEAGLRYTLERTLDAIAGDLATAPADAGVLAEVGDATRLTARLPLAPDMRALQNAYWAIAWAGPTAVAPAHAAHLAALGPSLGVAVPPLWQALAVHDA